MYFILLNYLILSFISSAYIFSLATKFFQLYQNTQEMNRRDQQLQPAKRKKGRPKGFDTAAGQSTIQSLDRALNVLDTLSSGSGMTLTEVAEKLHQSPATIYRVLTTLEARQFV